MAKIVIAGDAVVVTSSLKLEDIKVVEKYRPEELVLRGGDDGKEPIFAIGTTSGNGRINSVGVSFGREAADGSGLACITALKIDTPTTDNVKEWVADALGGAMSKLAVLESKLPSVLEAIKAEKAAVMESIVVVG